MIATIYDINGFVFEYCHTLEEAEKIMVDFQRKHIGEARLLRKEGIHLINRASTIENYCCGLHIEPME